MARAERQALLAVKTAKWVSFVYVLLLVVGEASGAETFGLAGSVLLLWTLLAFAMQDRIEKGGVTKEHPVVALVQATIWPGLPGLGDMWFPVVVGYALVALAFLVAAVLLQHALHAAREGERTDAQRRAHWRLGIGLVLFAGAFALFARPRPDDPWQVFVAVPVFLAFLAWSATHGFYVGTTRALLIVIAWGGALATLIFVFQGRGPTTWIPLGVVAAAGLFAFAGRPVPR